MPESFEGQSVLPIMRQHQDNQRKGVLGQLAGILCILNSVCGVVKITNSYLMRPMCVNFMTYVMIQKKCNNLFYDPQYNRIKKEMLEEMRAEMKRLNDPLENWVYRIIDEI